MKKLSRNLNNLFITRYRLMEFLSIWNLVSFFACFFHTYCGWQAFPIIRFLIIRVNMSTAGSINFKFSRKMTMMFWYYIRLILAPVLFGCFLRCTPFLHMHHEHTSTSTELRWTELPGLVCSNVHCLLSTFFFIFRMELNQTYAIMQFPR